MQTFKNLINGEWVAAANGATFENRNPAKMDEVIGNFPLATAADVQQAIEAANAALPSWANLPAPNRGLILDKASRILEARADELASALTREEGKTLAEATRLTPVGSTSVYEALDREVDERIRQIVQPPRSLAVAAPRGGSRSGPAKPDPRTPLAGSSASHAL